MVVLLYVCQHEATLLSGWSWFVRVEHKQNLYSQFLVVHVTVQTKVMIMVGWLHNTVMNNLIILNNLSACIIWGNSVGVWCIHVSSED